MTELGHSPIINSGNEHSLIGHMHTLMRRSDSESRAKSFEISDQGSVYQATAKAIEVRPPCGGSLGTDLILVVFAFGVAKLSGYSDHRLNSFEISKQSLEVCRVLEKRRIKCVSSAPKGRRGFSCETTYALFERQWRKK